MFISKRRTAFLLSSTVVALILCGACATQRNQDDVIKEMVKKHKAKPDNAPKVGDLAPNFKLKSRDGKSEVDLASFRGKKPVMLIFGSYT